MVKAFLSGITFLVWRLWLFLYERRILIPKRVSAAVVSVGNLTMGGTGKTPLTLFLAAQYQEKGRRVGIVSRGYRGNYKGPVAVVSDGETIFESAERVGDEPYLMAKRLNRIPIVVSKDRYLGCQHLIDHFKVDLILLDDGFQHLRLHRDLNILLIDATEKNRSLLPKGPMREPFTSARRADVVILTRMEEADRREDLPKILNRSGFLGPTLKTFFSPVELIHAQTGLSRPVSDLTDMPVLAFCGIGNPESFIKMLTRLKAKICDAILYRDHFNYAASDIKKIEERGRSRGVKAIITTEKDAVKIEKLPLAPIDIFALRIKIGLFDPPNGWEALFLKYP